MITTSCDTHHKRQVSGNQTLPTTFYHDICKWFFFNSKSFQIHFYISNNNIIKKTKKITPIKMSQVLNARQYNIFKTLHITCNHVCKRKNYMYLTSRNKLLLSYIRVHCTHAKYKCISVASHPICTFSSTLFYKIYCTQTLNIILFTQQTSKYNVSYIHSHIYLYWKTYYV